MMYLLQKNKAFKHLLVGRVLSNAGDSLYYVTLSWYLFETTQDAFWVGVVNFAILLPNIFSFLLGNLIDQYNKKKILICLEVGQAVFLSCLILIMAFQIDSPIAICCIAFFMAAFGMNTYVVQNAMIPIIVNKANLTFANQYMAVAFTTTDYLFNALSGVLIKILSTAYILVIDLMTFIVSIIIFKKIEYKELSSQDIKREHGLWLGFKIIYMNNSLFYLTFSGALMNFLYGGLNVYYLIISDTVGSPIYYGLLLGILSLGIAIGNTYGVNFILKRMNHGIAMIVAKVFAGFPLLLICFIHNSYSLLGVFFMFGLFLGMSFVLQPTFYQNIVEDQHLGKFFSAHYTFGMTTMSLGALFFGYISRFFSTSSFMLLLGVFQILLALFMYKFDEIRRFKMNTSSIKM